MRSGHSMVHLSQVDRGPQSHPIRASCAAAEGNLAVAPKWGVVMIPSGKGQSLHGD